MSRFSRKVWGLLSLELWQQRFHDRAGEFGNMLIDAGAPEQPNPNRVSDMEESGKAQPVP